LAQVRGRYREVLQGKFTYPGGFLLD
jgi:hypothetical protein